MANQVPTCTPYGFSSLTKHLIHTARPFLPARTRIIFERVPEIDDETLATCDQISPNRYSIQVVSNLTYLHTVHIVLHEISHAIHWGECGEREDDHGEEFWKIHGQLYCRYLDCT